jgi:hypothetical protein
VNIVGKLNIQADVLAFGRLETSGHLRLPDGPEPSFAELLQAPLCTLPQGCVCPDGSPGAGTQFIQTTKGVGRVAFSGGLTGAEVVMNGSSLEDFCQQDQPTPSTPVFQGLDKCLIGTWSSTVWKPVFAGAGGSVEYSGGQGALMTVAPDGRVVLDFEPMTGLTGNVAGVVATIKFYGSIAAQMTTAQNQFFTVAITDTTFSYLASVEGFAGGQTVDLGGLPAAGSPIDVTFTCTETTLDITVTGAIQGGSTWTRVG